MATWVLIVDDDIEISQMVRDYLRQNGYNAEAVNSAEEAVIALRNKPFSVVISDIILPGMDGLSLTEKVKTDYSADVIVMTGYSDDYSYEMAIQSGASDLIFKPMRFEELLLRLKRVIKERHLTQERLQMLERLQKIAITDSLTKLYNSRHFFKQMAMEIDRSMRYRHPLSLLLLDIDHFKRYNDQFGHVEGDKVLRRIGRVIAECLRTNDSAYRYGGEEFTVILPVTSGQEANAVGNRIRKAVEAEAFTPQSEAPVQVTVSVGATQYVANEELSVFLDRSDSAMYLSKKNGRNRVSVLMPDYNLPQMNTLKTG